MVALPPTMLSVTSSNPAMIEYSVRKHFPDLPDTTGPQSYARKYLEKLIQVPFRIPAWGEVETRIYVPLPLVGDELGEAHPAFVALLTAARERLKQPWLGQTLDSAAVRKAMGDDASKVGASLALSDQIGPILTIGTDATPDRSSASSTHWCCAYISLRQVGSATR